MRLDLALLVLWLGGAAGCGKSAPAAAPPDPRLARIMELATAACACASYECADDATRQIFNAMGDLVTAAAPRDQAAQARLAVQRAAQCKAKLPRPAAPPTAAPARAD